MAEKVRTLSNGESIYVNEHGVYYIDTMNDINRGYVGCHYADSSFAGMNLDRLVSDYEFRLSVLKTHGDMVVMWDNRKPIKLNEGRWAFSLSRSYIEKRIKQLSGV